MSKPMYSQLTVTNVRPGSQAICQEVAVAQHP